MSYEYFKQNLKTAKITNTDFARALGISKQAVTYYNTRSVPVCITKLSEVIVDLASHIGKDEILKTISQKPNYEQFKEKLKDAQLNNRLFAEMIGINYRSISDFKRQSVPVCAGALAMALSALHRLQKQND